jgi:hypothetical protein
LFLVSIPNSIGSVTSGIGSVFVNWLRESLLGPGASSRREGGARDNRLGRRRPGRACSRAQSLRWRQGGFWVGSPCGLLTLLSSSVPEALDPEGADDGGTVTILPGSPSRRTGVPRGGIGGELRGPQRGPPNPTTKGSGEGPGKAKEPEKKPSFHPRGFFLPVGSLGGKTKSEGGGGLRAPPPSNIFILRAPGAPSPERARWGAWAPGSGSPPNRAGGRGGGGENPSLFTLLAQFSPSGVIGPVPGLGGSIPGHSPAGQEPAPPPSGPDPDIYIPSGTGSGRGLKSLFSAHPDDGVRRPRGGRRGAKKGKEVD